MRIEALSLSEVVMEIHVWSDVACPWCYIGKRSLESALADFDGRDEVVVRWRSFELDPGAPAKRDLPMNELLAKKYGMSAQSDADPASHWQSRSKAYPLLLNVSRADAIALFLQWPRSI